MSNESCRVRAMNPGDIPDAYKLSNAEGWNQTESEWRFLLEGSQNTCLVAEWSNKVIGTTTAVNYSNKVAWIGMVLVDTAYRGRGVGTALLTKILQELETCKSIKLDATPQGQAVYKKFKFENEIPIARMTISEMNDLPGSEPDAIPQLAKRKDIPELATLDELVFGANRIQLIEYLITTYPEKSWILKRNNRVVGCALGRDGNKYHYIGPVMVTTTIEAKMLITHALRQLNKQPVVVDVPYDKKDLMNWLQSIGFIQQRKFFRMYKEENPFPGIISRQYSISGPEFG